MNKNWLQLHASLRKEKWVQLEVKDKVMAVSKTYRAFFLSHVQLIQMLRDEAERMRTVGAADEWDEGTSVFLLTQSVTTHL